MLYGVRLSATRGLGAGAHTTISLPWWNIDMQTTMLHRCNAAWAMHPGTTCNYGHA
jgi:hypothetical protein